MRVVARDKRRMRSHSSASGNIAKTADSDGGADSKHRQPADVVGGEQQLRRPIRLEVRGVPPIASARHPVFVGVQKIAVRGSFEGAGHLVERRWRQRVVLAQERRKLTVCGAKRGVPCIRAPGAGRHAENAYAFVALDASHGLLDVLNRVLGSRQGSIPTLDSSAPGRLPRSGDNSSRRGQQRT